MTTTTDLIKAETSARPLTPREYEALIAYARTGGRQEAADALAISTRTLSIHLAAAFRKLDVYSSIAAFRALGWIVLPSEEEVQVQNLEHRVRALQDELLALLDQMRASGSDADGPVPVRSDVAETPTLSLRRSA